MVAFPLEGYCVPQNCHWGNSTIGSRGFSISVQFPLPPLCLKYLVWFSNTGALSSFPVCPCPASFQKSVIPLVSLLCPAAEACTSSQSLCSRPSMCESHPKFHLSQILGVYTQLSVTLWKHPHWALGKEKPSFPLPHNSCMSFIIGLFLFFLYFLISKLSFIISQELIEPISNSRSLLSKHSSSPLHSVLTWIRLKGTESLYHICSKVYLTNGV